MMYYQINDSQFAKCILIYPYHRNQTLYSLCFYICRPNIKDEANNIPIMTFVGNLTSTLAAKLMPLIFVLSCFHSICLYWSLNVRKSLFFSFGPSVQRC